MRKEVITETIILYYTHIFNDENAFVGIQQMRV